MSRLLVEAYARNAIEGHIEACKEIVANYAHVYREPPKDVLVTISVMLMNQDDYSYDDYRKIKETIRKLMR